MNILVCVKRVPAAGGKMSLTADEQEIDTRYFSFTVSPHEECAVEEAVRLIEANGGVSAVLTLGADAAVDQLREAMALGIERAILLETDGRDWDAGATAQAIIEVVRAQSTAGMNFDLLLFGNEAADTGDYQVGVRVAHALDLPCVTGVKKLRIQDGLARAEREASGGWDIFEVPLPAVITVKEGLNLPRYPSLPGRLKAKKKPIERLTPRWNGNGLEKVRLKLPPEQDHRVEVLGKGPEAAPKVIELFQKLGVLSS
jgi:electron transfer flavoprotein beta subunit